MKYRIMEETDITAAAQMYVDYYNKYEDGELTMETAAKRIHQVWSREDSYCLLLEEEDKLVAFAFGYMEQYDDCFAYDLVEIVVAKEYQRQGIGTSFMQELEARVKEQGAMLIQLDAVNDEFHEHFYGKLGYGTAKNFVLKTKML